MDKNKKQRIIAHIDMDAFFASIEERDKPRIKGLPIAVGSDPLEGKGRGVVSTANYKAREYGIRSALPISRAWQYSQRAKRQGKPEVVFLPVDMRKYGRVSDEIMAILRKYTNTLEEASIDEAYLDLSDSGSFEKAEEICRKIKKEIWDKEKLAASMGLGPNKLIAKIASDMNKPDGLTVVLPEDAEKFMEPLSIRKIPGIGPKTEQYLNKLEIYKVKDLKKYSKRKLEDMLGKWGVEIYRKARGLSDAPVSQEHETKSVGEQETFDADTLDFQFVFGRMKYLCEGVIRRLERSEFSKFKTIVITVRFGDFETKTRSHTLGEHKSSLKELITESTRMLMPFFDRRENPKNKKLRLIGTRIEKLL